MSSSLKYTVAQGHCRSLGATIEKDGVNFAVYCPAATVIELLLFKNIDDDNPQVISLSSQIYRSVYYWHVFVKGCKANQIYAWRVREAIRNYKHASSHVEIGKVLLDPYGRRVVFPKAYQRFQTNDEKFNVKVAAKSVVIDTSTYDWGVDPSPRHSLNKTVIYEMHVKGFTAHESSGVAEDIRGTYRGLIEKIPYLVDLGVNAVELLPVYQYDKDDALPGKQNYWGYSPMSFFAPHEAYSSDRSIMGPLNEFRDMVKALHRNGIEVILDVVYNHTSEGDQNGPCYCYKGLDKRNYYIMNDQGQYYNYSGCGNTLNANNPVVRSMILDSLIFWKEEMHVDGFRFDLASILARDDSGMPIPNAPALLDIDNNFRLADAKIIAEPWDAGGLYQLGNIAGTKWREWNGQFRDDVRSFMRGDSHVLKKFVLRMIGSPDIYNEREIDPQKSINFITCHDGFTLYDLVSYAYKHNADNGEHSRDGNNNNYSANYGVEGETENEFIRRLRLRQCKNMMAITILSMGTPMILMGDEILRTQKGNNNAYCQDNDISYMNWNLTDEQEEMLNFTRQIIKRRTSRALNSSSNRTRSYTMLDKLLRNTRIQWHGVMPFQADWSDNSHSIGIMAYWGVYSIYAYVFVNAYWEDLEVELPPLPRNSKKVWYLLVNTNESYPKDVLNLFTMPRYHAGEKIHVENRSLIILVSPAF